MPAGDFLMGDASVSVNEGADDDFAATAWCWRRRAEGVALALLGIALLCVVLRLMPWLAGVSSSSYWSLYDYVLGASQGGTAALERAVALRISDEQSLAYVAALSSVVGGLYVLAPDVAVVAAPAALVHMLIDRLVGVGTRYDAIPMAALFAASAVGAARAVRFCRSRSRRAAFCGLLIAAWVVATASVVFLGSGPMLLAPGLAIGSADAAQRDRVLDQVPRRAFVSACVGELSHLACRTQAHAFPNPAIRMLYGPTVTALRRTYGFVSLPLNRVMERCFEIAGPEYIVVPEASGPTFGLDAAAAAARSCAAYQIVGRGGGIVLLQATGVSAHGSVP